MVVTRRKKLKETRKWRKMIKKRRREMMKTRK
jgi:hypothetical protein